jgi:hypothetical protein
MCCLHSAKWWQSHWDRSGIVKVELADEMTEGWRVWLDWQRTMFPDNSAEIAALESDGGRYLGYIRAIGRRRADAKLEAPIVSMATEYERKQLLRDESAD